MIQEFKRYPFGNAIHGQQKLTLSHWIPSCMSLDLSRFVHMLSEQEIVRVVETEGPASQMYLLDDDI